MRKLLLGMITMLLLINQAYPWGSVCIKMQPGIDDNKWTQINIVTDQGIKFTRKGERISKLLNMSCANLRFSMPIGQHIDSEETLYVEAADQYHAPIQCPEAFPIRQNQSTGTLFLHISESLNTEVCKKDMHLY